MFLEEYNTAQVGGFFNYLDWSLVILQGLSTSLAYGSLNNLITH